MKLLRPAAATAVTEGIIVLALWKLGAFPVFYLMITAWILGFWFLAGTYFILTWGLLILWLAIFNGK